MATIMMRFTLPTEKLNSSAACGIVSNPTYAHGATATMARIPASGEAAGGCPFAVSCLPFAISCSPFTINCSTASGPQNGQRFDQCAMGLKNVAMTMTRNAVASETAMTVCTQPAFLTPRTDSQAMSERTASASSTSPSQMS